MTQAPIGRPRKAGYDERIQRAAVHVFAERGWLGFTFDRVAHEAGVGKPSVYRRWDSPQNLLFAALAIDPVSYQDCGSLESDLAHVIGQGFDNQLGDLGTCWLRLLAEARTSPELQGFYESEYLAPSVAAFDEIVARATARGEILRPPSIGFLMELAMGPVVMRVAHSESSQALVAQKRHYVARLAAWMSLAITAGDPG